MTPPPVAVGLFICDRVIVDHQTRNPSPISIFNGLAVDEFPSDPQRLSVFAILTNGRGDVVYEQEYPISFADPLLLINVNIRIRTIVFPEEGMYEFVLLLDGDPVADRRLRVYSN